jgi:hypothetical protein
MAFLSAPFDVGIKPGEEVRVKMAAVKIYRGGAVGVVSGVGYATPLVIATSGMTFIGVATETVDNSAGSPGDKWIRVICRGLAGFNSSGITVANVGEPVYFVSGSDDNTVGTSSSGIFAGNLRAFDSNSVAWVDIYSAVNPAYVVSAATTFTGLVRFAANNGAAAANALLAGVGTDVSPSTTATANKDFLEFRCQSTATTGTSRTMYLTMDGSGAGAEVSCLRPRTIVNAFLANAYGMELGLEFTATVGKVTGQAAAARIALLAPAAALPAAGTYYGAQITAYLPASASMAAVTRHALLHLNTLEAGDSTASATFKNCFAIDGVEGTGNMIKAGTTLGTAYGSLGVLVNGVRMFIPLYVAQAS